MRARILKRFGIWACLALLTGLVAGCTKLALRLPSGLLPGLRQAMFEECDPTLAQAAMPAQVKLAEGLLRSDPFNRQLLLTVCMGLAGYAQLFVEEEDPARASDLYARAAEAGLRALGLKQVRIKADAPPRQVLSARLETCGEKELEALFWTALAWNAWIRLNLDRPAALGQLDLAAGLVLRVLEIDPGFFFGTGHVLMGTLLSARPPMLGGMPARARVHFEEALRINGGRVLLTQYYFARYYAVRVQDRELFRRLQQEIEDAPLSPPGEACLLNAVYKNKAARLRLSEEDLFL